MATQKTSLLKTSSSSSINNRGFTLVEILIVLAILAGLVAVGLPRIRPNQNNIKKVTREISVLSREIRNQARMKQMTHRLVFELERDSAKYWVEAAPSNILARTAKEEEAYQESLRDLDEEERPPSEFQKSTSILKNEKALPGNLKVASIETSSRPEPISQGLAYIYYTAEGLAERAAIQITDGDKLTWTLIVNPLTGRVDIVEKAMSLKDLSIE